jgi:valyl-tRNA synthetase
VAYPHPGGDDQFLAVQPYPTVKPEQIDPAVETQFDLLIGTIRTIRNLRAEAGIKPSLKIEAILQSDNPKERDILLATQNYIQDLGRVETLAIRGEATAPTSPASTASPDTEATHPAASQAVDLEQVAAEFTDFWVTMRPLLEEPLAYVKQIFGAVRRPGKTILIGLGALVVLKLISGVLSGLNGLPLVAPTLRLVGIGYTVWFIKENLLTPPARQATWDKVNAWRKQILGKQGATPPRQPVTAAPAATTPVSPAVSESTPAPTPEPAPKMFAGVVGTVQVLIPLTGVVDVEALRAKLEKDLGKLQGEIKSLSGRLGNQGFVAKAPADVVQGAKEALAEAQKQTEILEARLAML